MTQPTSGPSSDDLPDLLREIHAVIRRQQAALMQLAQDLWDNAERTGQEFKSAEIIKRFLAEQGFTLRPSASGLPTAFIAEYGEGPLVVDISMEYDALPVAVGDRQVSHACGHNTMAAMSVAAGLAIKAIADKAGIKVRMQGDPGEEGLGYKIRKLEEGDYDGAHIYIGAHAAGGQDLEELPCILNAPIEIRVVGRAAHDSNGRPDSIPVDGFFDSLKAFFNSLQLDYRSPRGTIINYQGGPHIPTQPNVVGGHGVWRLMVRNPSIEALETVLENIRQAVAGFAHGLGLEAAMRATSPIYAGPNTHPTLARLYAEAAEEEGRKVYPVPADAPKAATDFWNVLGTRERPGAAGIHPTTSLSPDRSPIPLHTADMARAANPSLNPKGVKDAIMQTGAALAITIARIATDSALRELFMRQSLSVRDELAHPDGRPSWLSAPEGWDAIQRIKIPGTPTFAVDPNLYAKALDPNAAEFQLPAL